MTDYFLATDGDDANSGSIDAPFGTLDHLMGALSAGDTGYVRGGTHYPTGFADGSAQQGTATAPIRLTAYDGEDVVFDFSGDTYGALRLWDCAYWELSDFTVRDSPSYGVYCFGGTHDCTLENLVVDGSGGDPETSGAGIYFYQAPDNLVRNCVSRNNYDPSSGGGNADGFVGESAGGTVFEDCVAYGNSDDGFDLWRGENEVIRGCVAYDNGYDPDGNEAGDGNGFKLGGGATSGGHRIERCVSYRNAARGFHYNEADIPIEMVNCTAWQNPTNFWFAEVEHVLRNNLSAEGGETLGTVVDDAYNSWNLGITSPSFASTDPTSPDFLRLSTDSPAIDVGTDVGLSYNGEAPDLGAYETESTATDTTTAAALNVATRADDGTIAFQSGALMAHDGAGWVAPTPRYYDGTEFVAVGSDDGTTTDPALVEGFESGDLSAYQGDRSAFAVTTDRAAAGDHSLVGTTGGSEWKSVLAVGDADRSLAYGTTVRVRVFLTDSADSAIVRFGVAGSSNWIGAGYNANENGIQISEAVAGSWSQVGGGSLTPVTGEWMEWEIAWGVGGDDLVEVTCYDAAGTQIGAGSATASDHRSDEGIGFEYTAQYGGTGPVYFDDLRVV